MHDDHTLRLFTQRYSNFTPDQGVPIRTTLGHPRFKLRYELAGVMTELAPDRAWFKAAKDVFRVNYRAKLDLLGTDEIVRRVSKFTDPAGDPRAVLLCFDDLTKGAWCHRTMFGEWWQDRTGIEVVELQTLTDPTIPMLTQPSPRAVTPAAVTHPEPDPGLFV